PSITNYHNRCMLHLSLYDLTQQPATTQTKSFPIQRKEPISIQLTTCKYNHDGSLFACTDTHGNIYIVNLTTSTCSTLPKKTCGKFKNIFFYDNSSVFATTSTKPTQ